MKNFILYLLIFAVIISTIFLMIVLGNNAKWVKHKNKIRDKIVSYEAHKINDNYPWIYNMDNNKYIIPYFNINNKEIKKINNANLKRDLSKYNSTSYLYSINGDILSVIFNLDYNDRIEYEIYNFNLGTNHIMSNMDMLNLIGISYNNVVNQLSLSLDMYLKQNSINNNNYIEQTISLFENDFLSDKSVIYLDSNKNMFALVNIVGINKNIIFSIIDK